VAADIVNGANTEGDNTAWKINGSHNTVESGVSNAMEEGSKWFANNSLTTFSNGGYLDVDETNSARWSINSICNIGSFRETIPISRDQPGTSLTDEVVSIESNDFPSFVLKFGCFRNWKFFFRTRSECDKYILSLFLY